VNRELPTEVQWNITNGGNDLQYISIGTLNSGVLLKNGFLYVWGSNTRGQLGDGTYSNQTSPLIISTKLQLISSEVYNFNDDIIDYFPTKDGYTFDGWYMDSTLTLTYEFSKMPANDLVLYAKWILN
jgi:uncharacterized repeat protein (TIGR02543 family)